MADNKEQISFLKKMLGMRICEALEDDDITEIMANPNGSVWFESRKNGMYQDTKIGEFESLNFLLQLAKLNDLYLNFDNPYLETLLPFGRERIEGTIPPVSEWAAFTIRKPAKFVYPLETYVEKEIISQDQHVFICKALLSRKNILISGGPGTGKTTLANAIIKKMSEICDQSQRVLILEDTAEIKCEMPNVLSMVTSQKVSMTTLLKIAMRSRPDRILVGEVRDSAALDLLKSWNTGCPGGIATIHANSTEASVLRLLSLAQEANVPPPYDLVKESVDVLINVVRNPTHPSGREVKEISEINGLRGKKFEFNKLI
jgi:P-type conjugative transfer ATPase TrbB